MSKANWSRSLGTLGGVTLLSFAAALAGTISAAAAPIAPEGIWYTSEQDSIIRVSPCTDAAEAFCGTLVWLKEPTEKDGSPKLDTLNKDPAKKDKPMIGLKILIDLKADDDHWTGKAYNPENGKFYDVTFKVKTEKEENDRADLRGCILGFLCKTETFERAKDVPGGDPTLAETAVPVKKHKGAKKDSAKK